MEQYKFIGKHYLASYRDCNSAAINDLDGLVEAMIRGIVKSGATILSKTEHTFDGNGFTILFLLSESHCSIHTYPEQNALFTDLFTCGETCDYTKFEAEMVEYLRPGTINHELITRN